MGATAGRAIVVVDFGINSPSADESVHLVFNIWHAAPIACGPLVGVGATSGPFPIRKLLSVGWKALVEH